MFAARCQAESRECAALRVDKHAGGVGRGHQSPQRDGSVRAGGVELERD